MNPLLILKPHLEALIFDLDGTLWDCVDTTVEAWNKSLLQRGLPPTMTRSEMEKTMGWTVRQVREGLFPGKSEDEATRLLNQFYEIENQLILEKGGQPYPNLKETLEALTEKYQLFLVSNCGCGYIESFLSFYQLEKLFTDHECNGATGLPKGENIRLVMHRNGIQKACYVGDTESDAAAAEQAGIPFLFASYGFGQVEKQRALASLSSVSDLTQLL